MTRAKEYRNSVTRPACYLMPLQWNASCIFFRFFSTWLCWRLKYVIEKWKVSLKAYSDTCMNKKGLWGWQCEYCTQVNCFKMVTYSRCWREWKFGWKSESCDSYSFWCLTFFRHRVCIKDSLIQKCYSLLKARRGYLMLEDLVPSIHYLISVDLLASWRICDGNSLTSALSFSLAPVLYHELRWHGGSWPRGTSWVRSSSSKLYSLSPGSHGFQQAYWLWPGAWQKSQVTWCVCMNAVSLRGMCLISYQIYIIHLILIQSCLCSWCSTTFKNQYFLTDCALS